VLSRGHGIGPDVKTDNNFKMWANVDVYKSLAQPRLILKVQQQHLPNWRVCGPKIKPASSRITSIALTTPHFPTKNIYQINGYKKYWCFAYKFNGIAFELHLLNNQKAHCLCEIWPSTLSFPVIFVLICV